MGEERPPARKTLSLPDKAAEKVRAAMATASAAASAATTAEDLAPPAEAFRRGDLTKLRLKLPPEMRQVYWCEFWYDTIEPEFGKWRPVLIISRDNALGQFSLVLPITTVDQGVGASWAHRLATNPNPRNQGPCWVVANHIYSVSHYRLNPFTDGNKRPIVPKIPQQDFQTVIDKMHSYLPVHSSMRR
jgi:mRNA interferase MazF